MTRQRILSILAPPLLVSFVAIGMLSFRSGADIFNASYSNTNDTNPLSVIPKQKSADGLGRTVQFQNRATNRLVVDFLLYTINIQMAAGVSRPCDDPLVHSSTYSSIVILRHLKARASPFTT